MSVFFLFANVVVRKHIRTSNTTIRWNEKNSCVRSNGDKFFVKYNFVAGTPENSIPFRMSYNVQSKHYCLDWSQRTGRMKYGSSFINGSDHVVWFYFVHHRHLIPNKIYHPTAIFSWALFLVSHLINYLIQTSHDFRLCLPNVYAKCDDP